MKATQHQISAKLRWVFRSLAVLCVLACPSSYAATAVLDETYNQWKQALNTNAATPAEHITPLPGFTVELIRSAKTNEGSWVAMTFDPRGRVVIAREDRGLLRLTLSSNQTSAAQIETINTNLLECRGLLFAYDALYANANNSKGLFRLRDTDGDDQFDEVKLLKSTPGGVGHGRNQLALGPDGMIYSIHGDDVGFPGEGVATNSPLRHYGEDRLLPCEWDKHLFNASAKMPFGHLIRTDRDGKTWELVAGGLRNPFGIDFNAAGDLFTFDADMEWDVGLSWYHPTRVLHLVPGGDYGWRRGTGVLPVWSPDTLPSAVDIGVSSPTAVKFGARSNWPEPWLSALFILDWSYGKIFAVHLRRAGASYTGRSEVFLKGRPLNVTGLDFGPDGAMYFVTGGRRTQSGLYRVKRSAPVPGAAVGVPPSAPSRDLAPPDGIFTTEEGGHGGKTGGTRSRFSVPSFLRGESDRVHGPNARPKLEVEAPQDRKNIWSRLNNPDLWIRHAARVELESRPVLEWQESALNEPRPTAAFTTLLALSRAGDPGLQTKIVCRIDELTSSQLTAEEQLIAIRALAVCFMRQGKPDRGTADKVLAKWEPLYPADDGRVNQSLCELLVYLDSTNVVRKTIPLLGGSKIQEEKLHYLFTLRLVKSGWTMDERRTYFDWLLRARTEFNGANMLPTALNYIRAEAESTLTSAERTVLAETLATLNKPADSSQVPAMNRAFVKEWTMPDFDQLLDKVGRGRDAARGKRLFTETGCAQCHRLGSEGGFIGPDLTAVASRFDRRALLESVLEPSKVVAEVYRVASVTTKLGAIFDGRVASEDSESVVLAINPVDPDQRRRIAKADIAEQRVSDLSPMPAGLVNTLAREEILDLLAWIESGGDASHRNFKP